MGADVVWFNLDRLAVRCQSILDLVFAKQKNVAFQFQRLLVVRRTGDNRLNGCQGTVKILGNRLIAGLRQLRRQIGRVSGQSSRQSILGKVRFALRGLSGGDRRLQVCLSRGLAQLGLSKLVSQLFVLALCQHGLRQGRCHLLCGVLQCKRLAQFRFAANRITPPKQCKAQQITPFRQIWIGLQCIFELNDRCLGVVLGQVIARGGKQGIRIVATTTREEHGKNSA